MSPKRSAIVKAPHLGAAAICCIALVSAAAAFAFDTTLVLSRQDISGAQRLSLSFEVSGAALNIGRSQDNATVVRAAVSSVDPAAAPALSVSQSEGTASALFSSGADIQPADAPLTQQWDITIGDPAVPVLMTLTCGGVDAEAELGGLPLASLSLISASSDIAVRFGSPTALPIEILLFAGSSSTLSLEGINATGFESFGILGSRNDLYLDFSGDLSPALHTVSCLLWGSSLQGRLAESIAARLSFLGVGGALDVSGRGWQRQLSLPFRKVYRTDDYPEREAAIDFDIRTLNTTVAVER